MKKKMNELLNGNIKYEKSRPEFSHDILEGKVGAQEIFRGSFFVNAPANEQLKGLVHCTNARIGFRPDAFSGYHENFVFEADTKGLLPGDHIKGDFILSTSLGEYRLPIDISVEAMGSSEKEYTLTKEEFAMQAQADFAGAYATFLSREFQKVLVKWGYRYVNLYRGVREQQVTYMSLEQFLIGAGLKKPVKLSLEKNRLEMKNVEESLQEGFVLKKENWGFAALKITSDADFIRIVHPQVSTEEFVGSTYEIRFVIEKEYLHAGKNSARITILNGYEEMTAEIEIHNDKRFLPDNDIHRQRLEIMQMLSIYLDYQTEKVSFKEWSSITQNTIDNYHKAGGTHIFYDLYETYLAAKGKNQEKALQMISQISERKEELKDPSMYAIYLTLTTAVNPNANYLQWVKEHIQTLYLENQENWIIQWLNLKVNPETIRNDTEKLDLIRRQFLCGCTSPIMYLEAYKILKQEPLMLRKLESFEIHLLQFICREHLLDREISGQAAQIAARMQEFQPLLFGVLRRCFEVFPTRNMLTAICSLLIAGRKYGKEYASWYALGIKQDVRITGLYEYFIETTTDLRDKLLPASVRMYFIYHNTLGYVKKAAIYANIVRNKKNDPDTYDEYRPSMERFAEEQVERGHINRDLALLYEELIAGELLNNSLAAGLERILFTYELDCKNTKLKEAIVFHEEYTLEQRVGLNGGIGNIQLLSPDAVVILGDTEGNRYVMPEEAEVKRLIGKADLEEACQKHLKEPGMILIHNCSRNGSDITISQESVEDYIKVLDVAALKDKYAQKVRRNLIDFFKQNPEDKHLETFIRQEQKREILPDKITDWMDILASRDCYTQVMDLVRVYGMEKVSLSVLVRMCHFCILKSEYAEDEMLLAVCIYCYEKNLYDEVMLRYMMKYYEGGAGEMISVWKKGTEYGLESIEMEERILGVLVFTEEHLEGTEQIFDSYVRRPGKAIVCRTYAVLQAYEYFVREKEVAASVFAYIETQMTGNHVPDVCRLALMKYLTDKKERTTEQNRLLRRMVEYYQKRGMYFAFYMNLPVKLKKVLNLYDKFIIEFRTTPNTDVILRYRLGEGKENAQIMQEMFEGVYVKEFTLFYADSLKWYIDVKNSSQDVKENEIIFEHSEILEGSSRYALINRMIKAREEQDDKALQELTEQYLEQQHLVEEMFPISSDAEVKYE